MGIGRTITVTQNDVIVNDQSFPTRVAKRLPNNGFQQLLEVPMDSDDEDKYAAMSAGDDDPLSNLILEVIKNDQLRKIERSKTQESEHSILMAAKLISPVRRTGN